MKKFKIKNKKKTFKYLGISLILFEIFSFSYARKEESKEELVLIKKHLDDFDVSNASSILVGNNSNYIKKNLLKVFDNYCYKYSSLYKLGELEFDIYEEMIYLADEYEAADDYLLKFLEAKRAIEK